MELFTIRLLSASQEDVTTLIDFVQQQLKELHSQGNGLKFKHSFTEQAALVTCHCPTLEVEDASQEQNIWDQVTQALAEYILSIKETTIIRSIIAKETDLDVKYQNLIEKYCDPMLNSTEKTKAVQARLRRKEKVMSQLNQYLGRDNPVLELDGFIQFRLAEYREELLAVVNYAIDDYEKDRQYQEFIKLLKCFVFIQKSKMPLAHLLHKGGHEFVLFNEQMQPLNPEHIVDSMMAELVEQANQKTETKDTVDNTLDNAASQTIIIHTREPDSQLIQTLQNIFKSRVQICSYS